MTGVQTCALDRKSTRLNSSHTIISYAVFCLKKTNRRAAASPRRFRSTRPDSIDRLGHLAQRELLDCSGRRLGELGEDHPLGHLETRQALPAPVDQLVRR